MTRTFLKSTLSLVGFACLVGLLGSNVFAQDKEKGFALADTYLTPELISFQPKADYDMFTLTVKGGDTLIKTEFSGLSAPFIETFDAQGNQLPDGLYRFELSAAPILSADTKDALRYARESGDYSEIAELRAAGDLPSEAMVQSGYFRIQNGLIIVPSEFEEERQLAYKDGRSDDAKPGTPTGGGDPGGTVDTPINGGDSDDGSFEGGSFLDQIINDDLLVLMSLCVGTDCANGESFGFDTIRLKENNLRIRFFDTSNSGSFPTRDWQITANDSDNGGADKFSIDDIDGGRTPFTIEANAPTHSLYVDDGGRIGLGTMAPVVEVHIKDGDTPTLRLEQDNSSGFNAQTWDVAGNETNFFVRDATNGSTLPFKIRPGAPHNSIYVDTDGDVGLGSTSPSASLHVNAGSDTSGLLVNTTADSTNAFVTFEDTSAMADNRAMLELKNNGPLRIDLTNSAGNSWDIRNSSNNFIINERTTLGTFEFTLTSAGNLTVTGTVTPMSDRNMKENFEPVDPKTVLKRVVDMPVSTWNYINDDDAIRHMGPMSQDFTAAFPLGADDKGISVTDMGGVTISAIQGLYQLMEEKDAKLEEKDKTIEELGNRLKDLENVVNLLRDQIK